MDQPIRRQIASLEAQMLSLRDALATLPPDQRTLSAEDLEQIRAVLAELSGVLTTLSPVENHATNDPSPRASEPAAAGDELIWTAERTTRLYAINTALSVALTQTQVAQIVVNQALPALAADGGLIALAADNGTLKVIDEAGARVSALPGETATGNSSPLGEAAQTAQSIWIESPEELLERYPASPDAFSRDAGSIAAVPLIAEGRVLGVMGFRFEVPRPFEIADRAFILVLAQQCAAALERVHLYEQVRRAAALEERNRLARDLHDSVSQALYAIILGVTVGRANLKKDLARVARSLDNIESLATAAQADLRALLFDLRADSVAQTGLVNALKERAQFLHVRHGLIVRMELCEEPALGPQCKDALYGIAREALHNAAKHARANLVELKLARLPEALVLEVKDDGVGFEADKLRAGRYGLQSMRERASELGAEFRIETASGRGTRVEVTMPITGTLANGRQGPPCST